MPLPVAHGLLGACVVAALQPRKFMATSGRLFACLLAGAALANAPDFDFLLVFTLPSKGWHRGFTHSLCFALLLSAALALCLPRGRRVKAAVYGLAFASHGLLDWATTKEGGGVELLWPFTGERFVPGWLGLSEIPSRLPAAAVLKFIAVEFALFAPPLAALLLWRGLWPKPTGKDRSDGA
ncbi:MAG TPA: metal-dependent hydrolase [Pyrinomonadaceae bacterium]|nr:metal-dependent hydrolase [Pyrinomonadaceae bacterium]